MTIKEMFINLFVTSLFTFQMLGSALYKGFYNGYSVMKMTEKMTVELEMDLESMSDDAKWFINRPSLRGLRKKEAEKIAKEDGCL